MDYNARYYSHYLNRFISPDTMVPEPSNSQAWNRYAYTLNNPLKFVDPSGHCWGFASGLRNTFYATTCNNLDMAEIIATSPDATASQKMLAEGYRGVVYGSHIALAIGATTAAVGCLTGAGTVLCTGAGSAVTAASADGNPGNEIQAAGRAISQLSSSNAQALRDFADRAISVNGNDTFALRWYEMADKISRAANTVNNNLFVQKDGKRILGAMEVESRVGSLYVRSLETIESGTGIFRGLLQTAAKESIARGFGGRLTMNAVNSRVKEILTHLGVSLLILILMNFSLVKKLQNNYSNRYHDH